MIPTVCEAIILEYCDTEALCSAACLSVRFAGAQWCVCFYHGRTIMKMTAYVAPPTSFFQV